MMLIYDILLDVFYYITSKEDLYSISRVCTLWNQACYDSGSWKIIKFLVDNKLCWCDSKIIFRRGCFCGHLDLVQWSTTNYFMCIKNLYRGFEIACIHGQLKVAKWIYQNFNFGDDFDAYYIFLQVCSKGYFQVAKWIYEIYPLYRLESCHIFQNICVHGHLNVAKWFYPIILSKLHQNQKTLVELRCGVFTEVCRQGYLKMAMWLYSTFDVKMTPFVRYALYYARQNGYRDTVEWLCSTFNLI